MPLLDHFHSPTKYVAPWSSIGTFWITSIVRSLNRTLPTEGLRAFAHVFLGHMVEADIAEFEMDLTSEGWENTRSGELATAMAPAPQLTFSPQFPDVFEVQIRDTKKGMTLVAVIEVVSPANKDRHETRRKLTRKCAGFLQIGVGVVLVDPVTNRSANLHNLIMAEIGGKKSPRLPNTPTYVSSYRPVGVEDDPILQVWFYEARIGEPIPSVPLPLGCDPLTMIDFEGTYLEALADNGFTEADLRGTN